MSKQTSELSPRVRRRVLGFADRIADLAAEAPNDDSRRAVYEAANAIRKRYGFSDREKCDYVFSRIKVGAASLVDLTKETQLDREDISRALECLEGSGRIRSCKQSYSGGGRPATLYFPAAELV